jgi:two-component system response regulator YesN
MQTCMLYDIYGTLVKAAEEQGCSITRFPRLSPGSGQRRPEVMRESFREIIEQICSATEQPAQSRQGTPLSAVIQEYVEAHYADPDLNVSQIAYHLHMTPAWVSATFKKQTGKSLLNAIKQVRIQSAKKLLLEGYSVLEVTKMTGFRESTTFIKIFKAGTGVTPGQYRKMNQIESDG